MPRMVSVCYQCDEGGAAHLLLLQLQGCAGRVSHRVEAEGATTQKEAVCLAFIGERLGSHRKELPAGFLAY